jgi:DNA-directed RNA polymerase subunit RPC12/RpoP
MGIKLKGGMWCPNCRCLVPGQKPTHPIRNTIASIGAVGGGLGVLLAKREKYICPDCGQPVRAATKAELGKPDPPRKTKPSGRPEWRCEKNGHLLSNKRDVCPIDGSPARWVGTTD